MFLPLEPTPSPVALGPPGFRWHPSILAASHLMRSSFPGRDHRVTIPGAASSADHFAVGFT